MPAQLAYIVAQARIARLALIGLAKNVGKTTTTNHLLETLLGEKLYRAEELALTSLGLDGEAIDALTGLPKPRYVPQAGLIVATTADLLDQAESSGISSWRCYQDFLPPGAIETSGRQGYQYKSCRPDPYSGSDH